MVNAISIDVEEYFHAQNLKNATPPSQWRTLSSRVEEPTRKILRLLEKHSTRGTFFVLGYVARRHPKLVKEIAQAGHEIASHGYRHQLVYELTPKKFLRDISISKKILEDLAGTPVFGYRAPNFSITEKTPWAYEQLLQAGYKYDSSIFPVKHPRYSNANKSRGPTVLHQASGEIIEIPLATASLRPFYSELRLPVAGGAYWRLLPRYYCTWGMRRINKVDKLPFVCYLHPWELDETQPRLGELPFLTRVRHYAGIKKMAHILEFHLKNFSFAPIRDIAKSALPKSFE